MPHSHPHSVSSIYASPKTHPEPYCQSLEEAISEAHNSYIQRNPSSLAAHNESCNYMPGGNTRTVLHAAPFPLTFRSGHDCKLTSLDGHTYIDFLGEYTAGIYGHNHPVIRQAIDDALNKGWNLGGHNTFEKELAKIVCERFSPTMELVRFTNSGTEANMMAIATAIQWTGRKKVLVFSNAYHGSTISFPHTEKGTINLPHEWVLGTYNSIPNVSEILCSLPPSSLAAILVEPMLGSGGAVPGDLAFLQYLRTVSIQLGALLIFDEVMTSRLSYSGLGLKLRVRPDLMTLGKWVGGGMSFGAFGGRRDIMEMYDPRNGKYKHAGTFNNNVVSMAAGCAGCKLLDAETINNLNALGKHMKAWSAEALYKHGVSDPRHEGPSHRMWISGIGSILCIHFTGENADALHGLFYHHMLKEGIYLAPRGFIALSIEIKRKHGFQFVKALDNFITKYRPLILGTPATSIEWSTGVSFANMNFPRHPYG